MTNATDQNLLDDALPAVTVKMQLPSTITDMLEHLSATSSGMVRELASLNNNLRHDNVSLAENIEQITTYLALLLRQAERANVIAKWELFMKLNDDDRQALLDELTDLGD